MELPAISVRDVSKTFRVYHDRNQSIKGTVLQGRRAKYEEFWALKDVSLDIPEGSTFGLLGRNGSGKSTLLKCIAGILTPNGGSIESRGRMAAMLEVGSGFHPELSGRENVYLNAAILGMSREQVDARFDEIVDFSGVERFIDHPVKNYSSGMYVRLGFSVAIHTDPQILLVDEVLAVGDMDFQAKCRAKFDELRAAGKTVVVVSHSLSSMKTFVDHAAWLEHGELQAVGPAEEIIDRYAGSAQPVTQLSEGGKRFGTGEVRFTNIEVLDAKGAPRDILAPSEPMRFRLSFEATERIQHPNFGLSLRADNKQFPFRISGKDRGWVPAAIEPGRGSVDIALDALPLAPGRYTIIADVRETGAERPADNVQERYFVTVGDGSHSTSGGLLYVPSGFESFSTGEALTA